MHPTSNYDGGGGSLSSHLDMCVCFIHSVLKILALRKAQAKNILEVLKMILQCLKSLSQPHCFVPPCIIFLLELLACQKDFTK